ncbi:hypothetical protein, partial [Bartonella queenslandensis]|uniref:hypothetical protein n=1 Tax=Bartonella queenslandensis TaxID=481138 RepID=UPI0005856FC7
HNGFKKYKKIQKNIKKDKILFDNKYVFCYINNQVIETLNVKRIGYETTSPMPFKILTFFYALNGI